MIRRMKPLRWADVVSAAVSAGRPRFGRADPGQSLLSRRKIVFRGVGGLGRCRKYRQQQADS